MATNINIYSRYIYIYMGFKELLDIICLMCRSWPVLLGRKFKIPLQSLSKWLVGEGSPLRERESERDTTLIQLVSGWFVRAYTNLTEEEIEGVKGAALPAVFSRISHSAKCKFGREHRFALDPPMNREYIACSNMEWYIANALKY